jgi:hypothetical protein
VGRGGAGLAPTALPEQPQTVAAVLPCGVVRGPSWGQRGEARMVAHEWVP